MILAGIFAIVIPPVAGIAVAVLVAWLLLFSGVAHLVLAWHLRTAGGFVWEFLLGILYIIVGTSILIHPVAGLASLTLFPALAICLLARNRSWELVLSFRLRPLPGSNWLLVDGVVTFILAIMIWRSWPSSTEWVIGTLVGISMLFSGISRLMISLGARSAIAKLPEPA